MLTLAAPQLEPRLAYAWQVMGRLLGPLPVGAEADSRCTGLEVRFEGRCLLRLPPPHPLLQSGYREALAPEAFGPPLLSTDEPWPGDGLALAFWLLTEYETWFDFPHDVHGRPVDAARWLVRQGLHHQPVLHRLAEAWAGLLRRELPRLPLGRPPFHWELGFDLDWPYRYSGRSAWVHGIALLRDLAALDWASARRRIHFMITKNDPYDVYEFIFDLYTRNNLNPRQHLLFFALMSAGHRYDTPYDERNPAYRQLLAWLAAQGIAPGIHPSYATAEQAGLIAQQAARLATLTGHAPVRSRQHFLRVRVPETYRALLAAGIRHEYTGCYATESGWRFGTSVPFPWYDLDREQAMDLWIHPVAAMDRALLEREYCTATGSLDRLRELAHSCRRWGGTFHVLLHNDTLSNCPPWLGWRDLVTQLVRELATGN